MTALGTHYVEDTSSWEDWQRDYRLGVILILPPPEVSRAIDMLRRRHDPRAFRIAPAHISVSDPLQLEMTPRLDQEVREILRDTEPFTLHYDAPHASMEHPGVAYPITPQEPIDDLKQALHRAAAFAGKVYRRRDIPAHMTIAEFISIDDGFRLCDQLRETAPSGSFLCDRLALVVPDADFRFHPQVTYRLGSSVKGSH